jgi:hypothetical protein
VVDNGDIFKEVKKDMHKTYYMCNDENIHNNFTTLLFSLDKSAFNLRDDFNVAIKHYNVLHNCINYYMLHHKMTSNQCKFIMNTLSPADILTLLHKNYDATISNTVKNNVENIMSLIVNALFNAQRRIFSTIITIYHGCNDAAFFQKMTPVNKSMSCSSTTFIPFTYDKHVADALIDNCLIKIHVMPKSELILTTNDMSKQVILPYNSKITLMHAYEDYCIKPSYNAIYKAIHKLTDIEIKKKFMTFKQVVKLLQLNYAQNNQDKMTIFKYYKKTKSHKHDFDKIYDYMIPMEVISAYKRRYHQHQHEDNITNDINDDAFQFIMKHKVIVGIYEP